MVFVVRQLQEKCQEENTELYSTYIDLTKVCDTAFGETWQNTAAPKNSSPSSDNFMSACMQDNGESSVTFPVTNGVKQGCVLAPTLFSIMFSVMLFDAFSSSDNRIDIRYRTDNFVFNLRRLQAKTKVKTDVVNEFLFADDCPLNVTTRANMQNIFEKFSMACENFGLTTNTKKTEERHQPAPGNPYLEPNITITRGFQTFWIPAGFSVL